MTSTERASIERVPINGMALEHAVGLIERACELAGHFSLVEDCQDELKTYGVWQALRTRDTPKVFDWLIEKLSFQGISDAVATAHIRQHGSVTWAEIAEAMSERPVCPKLAGYWTFHRCGNEKSSGTCAEPSHRSLCPLPRHPLRNGRLNQMAYSLYFFNRDVAGGDIVTWIDDRLRVPKRRLDGSGLAAARASLLDPLRQVYGVSDKVSAWRYRCC